jgi:hypothetical protein
MTMYETHSDDKLGMVFEEIIADIERAPVEGWLKIEARARLERLSVAMLRATEAAQAKDVEPENVQTEEAAQALDPWGNTPESIDRDLRRQAAMMATRTERGFSIREAEAIYAFLKGE